MSGLKESFARFIGSATIYSVAYDFSLNTLYLALAPKCASSPECVSSAIVTGTFVAALLGIATATVRTIATKK